MRDKIKEYIHYNVQAERNDLNANIKSLKDKNQHLNRSVAEQKLEISELKMRL
jgi:predicted RNase H-like nuclease (RuvC/YqgF family)